jgi:hypothetical protein
MGNENQNNRQNGQNNPFLTDAVRNNYNKLTFCEKYKIPPQYYNVLGFPEIITEGFIKKAKIEFENPKFYETIRAQIGILDKVGEKVYRAEQAALREQQKDEKQRTKSAPMDLVTSDKEESKQPLRRPQEFVPMEIIKIRKPRRKNKPGKENAANNGMDVDQDGGPDPIPQCPKCGSPNKTPLRH